jgi:ssDNA-binding Zn-finger/Zn-ribbon topoisomerase 1
MNSTNSWGVRYLPVEKDGRFMCPDCGTELVVRQGRHGEFYGCKNFPECRYTCSIDREDRERTYYDSLSDAYEDTHPN